MKLVLLLSLTLQMFGADVAKLVSARSVSISVSGVTPIYCPLEGATAVQVYIKPSSTAQIFTLTFPNGTTAEIPSGNSFTLRVGVPMSTRDILFSAQTASSSAVLQVVGFKETK